MAIPSRISSGLGRRSAVKQQQRSSKKKNRSSSLQIYGFAGQDGIECCASLPVSSYPKKPPQSRRGSSNSGAAAEQKAGADLSNKTEVEETRDNVEENNSKKNKNRSSSVEVDANEDEIECRAPLLSTIKEKRTPRRSSNREVRDIAESGGKREGDVNPQPKKVDQANRVPKEKGEKPLKDKTNNDVTTSTTPPSQGKRRKSFKKRLSSPLTLPRTIGGSGEGESQKSTTTPNSTEDKTSATEDSKHGKQPKEVRALKETTNVGVSSSSSSRPNTPQGKRKSFRKRLSTPVNLPHLSGSSGSQKESNRDDDTDKETLTADQGRSKKKKESEKSRAAAAGRTTPEKAVKQQSRKVISRSTPPIKSSGRSTPTTKKKESSPKKDSPAATSSSSPKKESGKGTNKTKMLQSIKKKLNTVDLPRPSTPSSSSSSKTKLDDPSDPWSAARRGELVSLRWDDLEEQAPSDEQNKLSTKTASSKRNNNKSNKIPFPPASMKMIVVDVSAKDSLPFVSIPYLKKQKSLLQSSGAVAINVPPDEPDVLNLVKTNASKLFPSVFVWRHNEDYDRKIVVFAKKQDMDIGSFDDDDGFMSIDTDEDANDIMARELQDEFSNIWGLKDGRSVVSVSDGRGSKSDIDGKGLVKKERRDGSGGNGNGKPKSVGGHLLDFVERVEDMLVPAAVAGSSADEWEDMIPELGYELPY